MNFTFTKVEYQDAVMDDQAIQQMIEGYPNGWNAFAKRVKNNIDFHHDRIITLVESLVVNDTAETRQELLESRMLCKAYESILEIPTEIRAVVMGVKQALEDGVAVFPTEGESTL